MNEDVEPIVIGGQPDKDARTEQLRKQELVRQWGKFIAEHHWELYLVPTFRDEVSAEYARRAGERLVRELAPSAYALIAWGEGSVGGRMHLHLLVGGLGISKSSRTGLDLRQIAITRVERLWREGVMKKAEAFNPRGGVVWYLPTHHELDLVGSPQRHRGRRTTSTNRSAA